MSLELLCPSCQSGRAHRSHRQGWWERAASLFLCYPYRCRACGTRFLHWRKSSPVEELSPSAKRTVNEIRATTRRRDRKLRTREILVYLVGLLSFLVVLYLIFQDRGGATGF